MKIRLHVKPGIPLTFKYPHLWVCTWPGVENPKPDCWYLTASDAIENFFDQHGIAKPPPRIKK